jgi:hypothetical protein
VTGAPTPDEPAVDAADEPAVDAEVIADLDADADEIVGGALFTCPSNHNCVLAHDSPKS